MPESTLPHHIITSVTITGGFLQGARLDFADGLNCIIGGRGTGKTTIVELLRFGLDDMPDVRNDKRRAKTLEKLLEANLGTGRVVIELQTKHEMTYTAERTIGEAVHVLDSDENAVPISLDGSVIFKADVYGQNEIEEIAGNPKLQLSIIDRFIQGELEPIRHRLATLGHQLAQNATDIVRLDRNIVDLQSQASEESSLSNRITELGKHAGPDARSIDEAHTQKKLRTKEKTGLDKLLEAAQKHARKITSATADFSTTSNTLLDNVFLEGPNGTLFSRAETTIANFSDSLTSIDEQTSSALKQYTDGMNILRGHLAESHAIQEDEYRQLMAQFERLDEKALERKRLQERLTIVESAVQELKTAKNQRYRFREARQQLVSQLAELRAQRFQLRKKVADELTTALNGTIKVDIRQSGDREEYKELLANLLKPARIKHNLAAEQISNRISPLELAEAIENKDVNILTERADLPNKRASIIIETLSESEDVYALDVVELNERSSIQLLDGDKYKDSDRLSTGQRCTAILPILLLQSDRPLLIDQPEDNLDNAFIYRTIVRSIKETKGNRQIIFATHNPNIPVLGDAKVFVLDSDGDNGRVTHAGSVDDLKKQIEDILEGGEEAFLKRKERYGH